MPVQLEMLALFFLRDLQHRFDHPTLQVLKKLIPELGQVSFLECESCQMSKQYCVHYPLRVKNERVDHPFELIHCDILSC